MKSTTASYFGQRVHRDESHKNSVPSGIAASHVDKKYAQSVTRAGPENVWEIATTVVIGGPNGRCTQRGTLTWGERSPFNGYRFDGSFVNYQPHGQGIMTQTATGLRTPCKWDENGRAVTEPFRAMKNAWDKSHACGAGVVLGLSIGLLASGLGLAALNVACSGHDKSPMKPELEDYCVVASLLVSVFGGAIRPETVNASPEDVTLGLAFGVLALPLGIVARAGYAFFAIIGKHLSH